MPRREYNHYLYRSSQWERELLWYDTQALLLEQHDNTVSIIENGFIPVLVILELYEKASILQNEVVRPMQNWDYKRALDNAEDFVLQDPAMFKLFPWMVDKVIPALELFDELQGEFDIP